MSSNASIIQRLRERTNGFTITRRQYVIIAAVALGAMTVIVLTGELVRLTGSGLGCPTWPRCYGHVYPPARSHAIIEFSNRVITVPVTIIAIVAWIAALRLRPYRRDLMKVSLLLPLGVVAQAVLGGFTVLGKLDYGWVMAHFCLSMLVILAATTLLWRALYGEGQRPRNPDKVVVYTARLMFALSAIVVFAGTAATAAAPDAGGSPGQQINRLHFDGRGTMDFVIHRHAEIGAVLGFLAIFLWWLAGKRSQDKVLRIWSTAMCIAMGTQGMIGLIQYETKLPAGLVWVHVWLACGIWIVSALCCFAAGRLQPEAETVSQAERPPSAPEAILTPR